MWPIKNEVVFYYEAKIIIEMWEKWLTRGGVYIFRDFQKLTPDYVFFSNLFINGKALIISEK